MTENEHQRLRIAADATAARALMIWAAKLLRASLPPEDHLRAEVLSAVRQKLSLARSDYLQMTFPEMTAIESDLWAAEAQDAFDRLAKEFESCLLSK